MRGRSRRGSATPLPPRPSGSPRSPTGCSRTCFPTEDRADFDVTLRDAIAVQRPPPAENIGGSGTSLAALGDLATAGFFAPEAHTRIAVVLTDGESQPFPVDRVAAALKRARIRPVLIRLGNASERVYTPAGRAETYRPARGTGVELARTALLLRASAYAEPEARAAIAEVADAVAAGDGVAEQSTTSVRELSLPLAFVALLPCSSSGAGTSGEVGA